MSWLCITLLSSCSVLHKGGSGDRGFDATSSCVKPGDPGNEKHVGQFCTPGGGECNGNTIFGTVFCTVDNQATVDWFCTKPCASDSTCGTGAVCLADPGPDGGAGSGPKGCVPTPCS